MPRGNNTAGTWTPPTIDFTAATGGYVDANGGYAAATGAATLDHFDAIVDTLNKKDEDLKALMKLKHLNRMERLALHKPQSDWVEGPAGEVCRNTESLVVSDIIKKYCKQA
jgi:hypothetical protein